MATATVKKVFENQDNPGPWPLSYTPNLDKFLLKAFNWLSHNYEVSRRLVVGFLLDLPDYYTLNVPVKSINISVLKNKFLLLGSRQNFNTTNDIISVNGTKIPPYFMLKYYTHRGLCFLKLSL